MNTPKIIEEMRKNQPLIKKGDILHCDECGREVKVLEAGQGPLVCCGKSMKLKKG